MKKEQGTRHTVSAVALAKAEGTRNKAWINRQIGKEQDRKSKNSLTKWFNMHEDRER
jgi:hypothetical protein